jgi:4-diphosphocytidyl-2-C-methyl-D-erythritol kinase
MFLFPFPLESENCNISSIMVKSYAKLNLILRIFNSRADGYHNLFSLFQRIDLWDGLTFEDHKGGIVIDSDSPHLPLDRTNLIYRAAELLKKKSNKNNGLKINIQKNIPIGAGLGGGSSNAAVTLLEINRLWGLGYSVDDLAGLGMLLGSDVPFFCSRLSSAWVSGRGENIRPASLYSDLWFVLVYPGFQIQTRDAYSLWDRSQIGNKKELTINDNNITISSFETLNGRAFLDWLENDFEAVIFNEFPVLKEIKKHLIAHKAEKVMLSGSGSTLFGIFFDEKNARDAEDYLKIEFPNGFIRTVRNF